jgi:hypothetical protein
VAGGAISYSSNAFVDEGSTNEYVRNYASTWNITISSFVSKVQVIYDPSITGLVEIEDLTGDDTATAAEPQEKKHPLNHDSLDRFETLLAPISKADCNEKLNKVYAARCLLFYN